jgi:hypothetical protein
MLLDAISHLVWVVVVLIIGLCVIYCMFSVVEVIRILDVSSRFMPRRNMHVRSWCYLSRRMLIISRNFRK